MVGREPPDELRAVLDEARRGSGRSVLVLGEAGIGKTTAVTALAVHAEADGLRTVWCWCSPGAAVPYLAVRPLLRELDLAPPDDEPGDRSGDSRPSADDETGRRRLFAAVVDRLGELSARRPLLVVLEDAHWADPTTMTLVRLVVDAAPRLPLCLVVTARDDSLEATPEAADALRSLPTGMRRLVLPPLDLDAVADLFAEVSGARPTAALAHRVLERTGGNPFLVTEVAKHLRDAAPDSIPRGAGELVRRRVEGLPPESREPLAAAAITGDPVDIALIAAVLNLSERDAAALLDGPVQAKLLVTRTDGTLRFAHALIPEVLVADLSGAATARLHERAALAWEARPVADPGVLARHWSRALGPNARDRAASWSLAEARAARRSLAFEQAVAAYRRGLAAPGEDALAVGLELAETLRLAGDGAAARAAYLDIADRAARAGRDDALATAALGLGGGLAGFEVALRDDEQVELLRAALVAIPAGDSELRAALLARLSVALTELVSDAERIGLAEDGVAMADRVGDPGVRVAALAAYCDAIAGPDHVRPRLDAARVMRGIADATGDQPGRLLARRLIVVALLELGDLPAADAEAAGYARIADRLGVPHYRWLPAIWRACRALLAGDVETAFRAADEAEVIGARADSVNAGYMVAAVRSNCWRADGTLGAHRVEIHRAFGDLLDVPSAFGAMAESAFAAGDPEQARRLVRAAAALGLERMAHDSEWLPGVWLVAEIAMKLADADAARQAYDVLTRRPGVFVVEGLGAAILGATDHMAGRVAAFLGNRRAAADHLDAASAAHHRTGSPVLQAATEAAQSELDARPLRPRAPDQPATAGEFRRAGRLWQLAYRGESAIVADSKGMADLARLLARPGSEVHVLDLVDATGAAKATATDAGELIDAPARAAYRARLAELDVDLAEAQGAGDLGRLGTLRSEHEFLTAELAGALGLGGRVRTAADPVERARKAVGMRIGTALRAVEQVHPSLANHLRRSVTTGRFCAYRPEQPMTWHT